MVINVSTEVVLENSNTLRPSEAFLVVTTTAPLAPREPYKAVAEGPLRMLTLSTSSIFTDSLLTIAPSTT